MLQFAHPEYLWGLTALPLLAGGFFFLTRWRRGLLARLVGSKLADQLAPDVSTGKSSVKQTSFLLSLGFLILAMANPQVGTRIEEVKREGIDLFVALDVSLRNTGVVVFNELYRKIVYTEVFETEPNKSKVSVTLDNIRCCMELARRLQVIVGRYSVAVIVAEFPHGGSRSSRAARAMAMSLSVVASVAECCGVSLYSVTPLDVKRLVSRKCAVDKKQVQKFVESIYGKGRLPLGKKREHVADALGALEVYLRSRKGICLI